MVVNVGGAQHRTRCEALRGVGVGGGYPHSRRGGLGGHPQENFEKMHVNGAICGTLERQ